MLKVIGGTRSVAQRIVAANQSQLQAAAKAQKTEEVLRVAQALATAVRTAAQAYHLAITTSVAQVFTAESMSASTGVIEVIVGNLRRESMLRINGNGYTGSGIDDIVKHFVMGWSWGGRGRGIWHGRITGFRTRFAGAHFIKPVLDSFRSANPDITITAPDGWE